MQSQRENEIQLVDPAEGQLVELIGEWLATKGVRLRGSLRLAMAETKLAVTTFALVIFLVVMSAGFAVVAWGLMLLAMVQALSLAGLKLMFAIIVIALLNLALAWALWRLANHLTRHMEFRATRDALKS